MRIVRIARRQIAHGRFTLHVNKMLIIVDLEDRFRRFNYTPYHDRRDLDRIAVLVVHLEFAALEVADAKRYGSPDRQRTHPTKALFLDDPLVRSEQLNNLRFLRLAE